MLFNVQVLRAIAALLVVHAHAAGGAGLNLAWDGGAHGVDLFFVISGFIIAHVAAQEPDRFMVRRLIRIVPIYWSSTLALFGLVLLLPNLFRTAEADAALLALSLVFLPAPWAVHTSDGIPHPTIAGGWTLNYEMYFYVVFALALLASRKRATLVASLAIIAVVLLVQLTGLDANPVAHFYGYPIVLEFVLGMGVFHAVERVAALERRPAAWEPVALTLAVVAGLVCIAFADALFGDVPRWYTAGLPSVVVAFGAITLERVYGWRITNRIALAVGDASYVLYLIQGYIMYAVVRLAFRHSHFSELVGQLVSLVLMAMCAVIAVMVYRWYEQPILRALKRRFLRRAPAPRPAAR